MCPRTFAKAPVVGGLCAPIAATGHTLIVCLGLLQRVPPKCETPSCAQAHHLLVVRSLYIPAHLVSDADRCSILHTVFCLCMLMSVQSSPSCYAFLGATHWLCVLPEVPRLAASALSVQRAVRASPIGCIVMALGRLTPNCFSVFTPPVPRRPIFLCVCIHTLYRQANSGCDTWSSYAWRVFFTVYSQAHCVLCALQAQHRISEVLQLGHRPACS